MKRITLAAALAASALALAGCGTDQTKPSDGGDVAIPQPAPSFANGIADVCKWADKAKPWADAALALPQTSAKAKSDIVAAEAVLWPALPAAPLCNANPLPTTLSSEQIAGIVIASVNLAQAIRGK